MATCPRPAGLLLTGGHSRRLGRNKATLAVGGGPWGERTAALLADVAAPAIEVGPGYTTLAHTQEVPAGQGPLAAVAAGWRRLRPGGGAAVLVVATDLPLLTLGLLRLVGWHPSRGCVVAVDDAGRPQWLCARYPAGVVDRAQGLVDGGHRAMRDLVEDCDVTWLAPSVWRAAAGRPDALFDVDTPQELAALVRSEGDEADRLGR